MSVPNPSNALEADDRFPSGRWIGFFLDRRIPGKHAMELILTFSAGAISGEGRDRVGEFVIAGNYDLTDGRCSWVKQYLAKHAVSYHGFNEGKGIWGTWELRDMGYVFTGGFHIWPEGMTDPTLSVFEEEADIPHEVGAITHEREFVTAG